MPVKDMRPGLKGRAGYRTVTVRGTRGRTFNGTVATRTNGTTLNVKVRSGAYRLLTSGSTKGAVLPRTANTWTDRLSS
jgi:hypothetical protein